MGPEHVTSSIGLIYLEIPELNWLAPPFNGETITSSQPGMLISSLLKVFWEGNYRTVFGIPSEIWITITISHFLLSGV